MSHEITHWLMRWSDGEQGAECELMRVVVPEMRRIARRCLRRERRNHTLQPTALVNEAYLQLVDRTKVRWQDRSHFFAMAAHVMRNILTDYARRRLRAKRNSVRVTFDEGLQSAAETGPGVIELSEALDLLEKADPRKARVVELRFFAGMSVEEAAAALQISPNTVIRDWSMARAWLKRELSDRSHS